MQSSNPVFTRTEGFNGKGGYAGFEPTPTQYGGDAGYGTPVTHSGAGAGRMTIDTVVQKTGMTLGLVFLAAAATWILTGDVVQNEFGVESIDPDKQRLLLTLAGVGAIGGFVLAMVNSFKRVVSPALVIGYALLEGVFIGAISKQFQLAFGGGVVTGAVAGTVAAVAGTLAAYRFFDIEVTNKFRTWVIAAGWGFVAVALLDVLLGAFGNSFGFNGFGPMGVVSSAIGVGLGVLFLILDFDFIEKGIAAGLPERESWRAAFGLTVSIIWIYLELLRLLAILRGD